MLGVSARHGRIAHFAAVRTRHGVFSHCGRPESKETGARGRAEHGLQTPACGCVRGRGNTSERGLPREEALNSLLPAEGEKGLQ